MTFTPTPDGTYGGVMKPSRMFRWFMARQAQALRRGRERMMSQKALLLVVPGRSSGRLYEIPVAYWNLPDGSWVVCASAGGARRHPAWYRNLTVTPNVTAVIAGEEVAVHAEELRGAEREAAWRIITASAPHFLSYAAKTDRLLPVIRLSRRSPAA